MADAVTTPGSNHSAQCSPGPRGSAINRVDSMVSATETAGLAHDKLKRLSPKMASSGPTENMFPSGNGWGAQTYRSR
jgi:hypothetical protein